jgi:hypothetical protein
MISEKSSGKYIEGSSRCLILNTIPEFAWRNRRKQGNVIQDSQYPGRNLKPGPPGYEVYNCSPVGPNASYNFDM